MSIPPLEPHSESDSGEDPIEGLVFETLERMEREGSAAIEQAASDHPEWAPQLRARLRALQSMGLVDCPPQLPGDLPKALGAYTLGAPLGEGGMGWVMDAWDPSLQRSVAIKWMRPDFAKRPSVRQRFLREGQAVARLSHPGIAQVYHVGQEGDWPYIVMERIEGCTLAAALDTAHRRFGPRPASERSGTDWLECVLANLPQDSAPYSAPHSAPFSSGHPSAAGQTEAAQAPLAEPPRALFEGSWCDVAARIARAVAEGLEHAHQAGILHRDVKASNVMLTPTGRVVLIDFGLARMETNATMTAPGSRLGSLPYTAPECVVASEAATAPSDVYSLGVVLFEMLTQRLPFRAGSEAGLVRLIERGRLPSWKSLDPALPGPLRECVQRCLRKDPKRRTPSAAALAHDLTRCLSGQPPVPHQDGWWAVARSLWRAHPGRTAGTLLAAGLLIVLPSLVFALRAQAAERVANHTQRSENRLALALRTTASLRAALPDGPALEGTHLGHLRQVVLGELESVEQRIAAERGERTAPKTVLAEERHARDPLLDEQRRIQAARNWLATADETSDRQAAHDWLEDLGQLRLASSRSVDAECVSIELLQWLAARADRDGEGARAKALRTKALHRTRALQGALPGSRWLRAQERTLLHPGEEAQQ